MATSNESKTKLRRDLGTLESYAVLIGILVGAGIFSVTSSATAATGPSIILAHLVLAPVILATSVAYLVFLSTPLGLEPGGEVLHIASTFRSPRLTFLSAWLKLIAYLGACSFLADVLAANLIELFAPGLDYDGPWLTALSLATLLGILAVHLSGVRWFGRLQVAMCAILAVSLLVLIVPGLFAVELANYRPFFTGGASGFGTALPSLFFAYAGFEALSQAAGEVKESRTQLPRVFVRGILATSAIFVAMSVVALGVLPASKLGDTQVPMSEAAATYLPWGAEFIVTLGAVMAVATSLNVSMLVPARLAWHMGRAGQLPRAFGKLHPTRSTPSVGLWVSFGIIAALILSGQRNLALGIAVVALMLLYAVHSLALIVLPKRNPKLFAQALTRIPRWQQLSAAWASVLALIGLVGLRFRGDLERMGSVPIGERLQDFDFTSLELLLAWVVLGLILHGWYARGKDGTQEHG